MRRYEIIGFQSPPLFLANSLKIISQRRLIQEVYLFTPLESPAVWGGGEDKNPLRVSTGF
jgi:hypothetical protein